MSKKEGDIKYIERELQLLEVGLNWTVTKDENHLLPLDEILYSIRGFVWSEKLGTQRVCYPADWWEAFKEHFYPKWLLTHYLVKYTERIFEARALFPDFQMPAEIGKHRLRLTEIRR